MCIFTKLFLNIWNTPWKKAEIFRESFLTKHSSSCKLYMEYGGGKLMGNTRIEQQKTDHPLKALDIMEALSLSQQAMGISELSTMTGLSKSTLHRVLAALVERQYVIKNEASKQYRLGLKVLSLSASILDSLEIKKLAREEMVRLADLTGETVHLICLDGSEGVYVDKVDTKNSVGLMSRVGKRIPLYCTSGGKALLAYQLTDWTNRYLDTVPLLTHTKNTITHRNALLCELEQIRSQSFSLDREEHHENITCIAVPILSGQSGEVMAAISVAAPSYRFSLEQALSYRDEMLAASHRISSMIS